MKNRKPDILLHEGGRLDERQLVRIVAAREGGQKLTDIAQCSEIVKHTLDVLARVYQKYPAYVDATLEHRLRRKA